MLRSPFKYLLFLFFICTSTKAQTYRELTDEAWDKYEKKEYESSALLYEKAFQANPNSYAFDEDYYNAACSWALAGKDSNAIANLYKAIDRGFADMQRMQVDPDLKTLLTEPVWKAIVDRRMAHIEKERAELEKGTPTYYWGMYFGILLVFFIYNLVLFISLKDITFLYYSASIFFLAQLHAMVIRHFGFFTRKIFFWIDHIPFQSSTNLSFLAACLMVIFHLLFISKFLNLKEISPRLFKINRWLIVGLSIFCLLLFGPRYFDTLFFTLLLISYLYSFVVAITCWRKGYRPAKFLVIASIFLTVGVSITLLNNLLQLGYDLTFFKVFRSDNLAFILFYGMLSFALGDKINNLKQEKLQAQEKALEVLEEKVKERTWEVVKQKEIIEEKNKDITDSILYAKRIQQSLLPTIKYIQKCLNRLNKN